VPETTKLTNKTTNFVVRVATPADTDKMLVVWQETADMLAKVDSRYRLAADAATRWQESLRALLNRQDIAVFVAESTVQEGHILGYMIGSVVPNMPTFAVERIGLVSDLAVDSHGKVGGIGRSLFDALKGWLREQGVQHVIALVPHRHAIAQAFWRALGATTLNDQMWLKLD
jgi:ribosomal protein S18 acetylase RimI-like enzyme